MVSKGIRGGYGEAVACSWAVAGYPVAVKSKVPRSAASVFSQRCSKSARNLRSVPSGSHTSSWTTNDERIPLQPRPSPEMLKPGAPPAVGWLEAPSYVPTASSRPFGAQKSPPHHGPVSSGPALTRKLTTFGYAVTSTVSAGGPYDHVRPAPM